VPEPPVAVAVNVLDWPTSITQEDGVMETVGAAFTVTAAAVEFVAAPVLSVTWTMKL